MWPKIAKFRPIWSHCSRPRQTFQATPSESLEKISATVGLGIESRDFAQHLDSVDPLKEFRKRFAYPKRGGLPIGKPSSHATLV